MAKTKFPKVLYVRHEDPDDNGGYFMADEKPEGEDGEQVAIYERKTIKKRKITEELI